MSTLASLEGPTPAVVAHRGASARVHENTIAAFRAARVEGADAVEFDVRRTGDDGYVAHHDALLGGAPIVDQTVAGIRAVAPHVPTFEEAMSACSGMWVNVEIKNSPVDPDFDDERRAAAAVAAWVSARRRHDDVLISSFDAGSLTSVHAIDRNIATGLVTGPETDPVEGLEQAALAGCRALHPFAGLLRDEMADRVVARAARLGLWVIAWTVDEPDQIRSLAAAGVHGLTTNDPLHTRTVLTEPA